MKDSALFFWYKGRWFTGVKKLMPFSYLRACAQVNCNSRGVGSDVSNSSKNFFITHVRFAPTHVDFVLCIHMCTHPWFTTSQSEANCSVYFTWHMILFYLLQVTFSHNNAMCI